MIRHALVKHLHIYTLLLSALSLLGLIKLTEDVVNTEAILGIDAWVYNAITLTHTPWLTEAFVFITNLVSPLNIFLLTTGLLLILLIKRRWEHAFILFFSLLGGVVIERLMKLIIERDRPLPMLIEESGFSFPSGHATVSTIFVLLLIYAYKDSFRESWKKYLFITAGVGFFALVSVSRVYLGVHWLSDVLAGICLGIFWVTLLITAARVINHFRTRVPRSELV